MADYSNEIVDDVIYQYRRLRGSPFKVARAVGLDVSEVWAIVEANEDRLSNRVESFGGLGRPELRPFIVARRKGSVREWDNKAPDVAQARNDYEAGTHEMTTGRDGSWEILYSIPRKRKQPRPDYFKLEI